MQSNDLRSRTAVVIALEDSMPTPHVKTEILKEFHEPITQL
jgi:hypothetical protein